MRLRAGSLLVPAWLRAEPAVAGDYLALKHHAVAEHAAGRVNFATAKELWCDRMDQRAQVWADSTGWSL